MASQGYYGQGQAPQYPQQRFVFFLCGALYYHSSLVTSTIAKTDLFGFPGRLKKLGIIKLIILHRGGGWTDLVMAAADILSKDHHLRAMATMRVLPYVISRRPRSCPIFFFLQLPFPVLRLVAGSRRRE